MRGDFQAHLNLFKTTFIIALDYSKQRNIFFKYLKFVLLLFGTFFLFFNLHFPGNDLWGRDAYVMLLTLDRNQHSLLLVVYLMLSV